MKVRELIFHLQMRTGMLIFRLLQRQKRRKNPDIGALQTDILLYRAPFDVFEAEVGKKYEPGNLNFTLWLSEQRQKYFAAFPDRARNQINGQMRQDETMRFHRWILEQHERKVSLGRSGT